MYKLCTENWKTNLNSAQKHAWEGYYRFPEKEIMIDALLLAHPFYFHLLQQ